MHRRLGRRPRPTFEPNEDRVGRGLRPSRVRSRAGTVTGSAPGTMKSLFLHLFDCASPHAGVALASVDRELQPPS